MSMYVHISCVLYVCFMYNDINLTPICVVYRLDSLDSVV